MSCVPPRALVVVLCYKLSSFKRTEYGGYRPKRSVSQRGRWLTLGSYVCDFCEVDQKNMFQALPMDLENRLTSSLTSSAKEKSLLSFE